MNRNFRGSTRELVIFSPMNASRFQKKTLQEIIANYIKLEEIITNYGKLIIANNYNRL